jgi:hypothetical protein
VVIWATKLGGPLLLGVAADVLAVVGVVAGVVVAVVCSDAGATFADC